jgi:acetylornithine deacetylase/succinyl-diaminopimelate desuccinylase-like protein
MAISLSDFERDALPVLETYTRIPCLSPAFDAAWEEHGAIDQAAELLADFARGLDFDAADVTIHRLDNRTPVLCVVIEATTDDEEKDDDRGTIVLYGHLDKQPPLGDWSEGLDPFTPVRRGNRLYGRGVADDGYSTFTALLAIEALEQEGVPHPRCVVLIEASEESGSPDLEAYLDYLAPKLGQVELLICLDSGALSYDRLWVTTSLRGVVNTTVRVEVLEQGVHSGMGSGVVPSSFRILRQLLDRIEDAATGDVLLRELHVEIPQSVIAAASDTANEFGDVTLDALPVVSSLVPMGEGPFDRIINRTWKPTLSVIGMDGIPPTAIAGNVLRPFTTATLSLRLPPTADALAALSAVTTALTTTPPHGARITISDSAAGQGWRSPELSPWLATAVQEASIEAFGRGPGFTGEGGSIPFLASLATRYPDVQFVATGVLGPHSNAHAIDEMLDLDMCVGVTNAVSHIVAAFTKRNEA